MINKRVKKIKSPEKVSHNGLKVLNTYAVGLDILTLDGLAWLKP